MPPVLSPKQIAAAAIAGGFAPNAPAHWNPAHPASGVSEAILAVAIALAESGGDLHNVGDGGASHGLWQIHCPSWPKLCPVAKSGDAIEQAKAAKQVRSTTRGWGHWTVFRNADLRPPKSPNWREHEVAARHAVNEVRPLSIGELTMIAGTRGPGAAVGEAVSRGQGGATLAVGQLIEGIASGDLLRRGLMIVGGFLLIALAMNALIDDLTGINPGRTAWEGAKTVGGAVVGGVAGGPAGAAAGAATGASM